MDAAAQTERFKMDLLSCFGRDLYPLILASQRLEAMLMEHDLAQAKKISDVLDNSDRVEILVDGLNDSQLSGLIEQGWRVLQMLLLHKREHANLRR